MVPRIRDGVNWRRVNLVDAASGDRARAVRRHLVSQRAHLLQDEQSNASSKPFEQPRPGRALLVCSSES